MRESKYPRRTNGSTGDGNVPVDGNLTSIGERRVSLFLASVAKARGRDYANSDEPRGTAGALDLLRRNTNGLSRGETGGTFDSTSGPDSY